MSLALDAVVRGRAPHCLQGSLFSQPEEHFCTLGRVFLPEEDNSALRNLSRFWNLFLGPPWSRVSIFFKKKPNTHVKHNCVRTSVFGSMLLFRCLLLSCLKWPAGLRVQESGQRKNLLEIILLSSSTPHLPLPLPPLQVPQALREWYFSAKVNLVEMLWPPPDCSQWHQALQAKQRHLGKITPLKLPAEELNLTPTNCCTIVTGINGIC